jgi:hypothetical protein
MARVSRRPLFKSRKSTPARPKDASPSDVALTRSISHEDSGDDLPHTFAQLFCACSEGSSVLFRRSVYR